MTTQRPTVTVRLQRAARERPAGVWIALVVVFVVIGFAIGAITGGGSSSPASVSKIAQPQAHSPVGTVPEIGSLGSLPTMRHRARTPVQTEPAGGGGETSEPVSSSGGGSTVAPTPTVSAPAPGEQSEPASPPTSHTAPQPGGGHKSGGEE
jgi:hypothetical protein